MSAKGEHFAFDENGILGHFTDIFNCRILL